MQRKIKEKINIDLSYKNNGMWTDWRDLNQNLRTIWKVCVCGGGFSIYTGPWFSGQRKIRQQRRDQWERRGNC